MSTCRLSLLVVSVLGLFGLASMAQIPPPLMLWQKGFGGSSNEFLIACRELPDNAGYILGGYSQSPSGGGKTQPNYGLSDYWVVRLDNQGAKVWERSFGGTQDDVLADLELTDDEGILVGGYSLSGANGNKTQPSLGNRDYWIIKLDGNGDPIWERVYGGDDSDWLGDIVPVSDGGFLLAGYSFSNTNATKTAPAYGLFDYWVVRIDRDGTQLWDRSYGGSNFDYLVSAQPTPEGGFILGGYSSSGQNGNKAAPNLGRADYWIVLVDTNGMRLSDHTFGGSADDFLQAILPAPGGGYYLGGSSASTNSPSKEAASLGADDYWLVRTDAAAQRIWDRAYGGAQIDSMTSLGTAPGNRLILAGYSYSLTGPGKSSEPFGLSDYWVVGVEADGTKVWDQCHGGSADEAIVAVWSCSDGTTLLGGYSFTGLGGSKIVGSQGGSDYWILKVQTAGLPPLQAPVLQALPQNRDQVSASGFRFNLLGQTNRLYTLESSSNLAGWQPFATNVLLQPVQEFLDPAARPELKRFYRARLRP